MIHKKKNNKSTPRPNKKIRIILVTLVIASLVLAWLSAPFLSGNFYSSDRNETVKTTQDLIDSIQLNNPAQSGVFDEGCNTNGSVGAQTRIACNVSGFKIATSKEVTSDIKKVEEELKAKGFQRLLLIGQNQDDFEDILLGKKEGIVRFNKASDVRFLIDPTFYRNELTGSDFIIKDLIRKGKISGTKNADEYFYGIRVSASYYSCSDVLFAPCLLKP